MRLLVLTLTMVMMALGVSAQTVHVQGSPNEIFRPLSKLNVQRIVDSGITQVGEMDLVQLLEDLDTVEWRTFALGFLGGSGGKRQTSVYFVETRMVVVNTLALQNLTDSQVRMPNWALHEALGALGYDDENYNLSTALTYVAGEFSSSKHGIPNPGPNPNVDVRADMVQDTMKDLSRATVNRQYGREGGTTIVGGGGDAPILELKQRLMTRLPEWLQANRPGLSEKKSRKAAQRLLAMPINIKQNNAYNSVDFTFAKGEVLIDAGANTSSERLFEASYIDALLAAVAPALLK